MLRAGLGRSRKVSSLLTLEVSIGCLVGIKSTTNRLKDRAPLLANLLFRFVIRRASYGTEIRLTPSPFNAQSAPHIRPNLCKTGTMETRRLM